jgi:O-antigen ligase
MPISNRVHPKMQDYCPKLDTWLVGSGEQLKNGIWPRSIPLWIAAFYIALFLIRPWEQLLPWLGTIHFERIYGLCMIFAVLFTSKKNFQMTFQSITPIFFLAAIALSSVFAMNQTLAWDVSYEYLTLVIFYFILLFLIRTPYDLIFIVISYITTMTVYLGKSQWEFFLHGQNRYDMGVYRLTGIETTFGGPNAVAMSIVVSLPFVILLWHFRKEISCGWPDFWRKWFPRFLVFYFILSTSTIILTNSRSGMVSFALFVVLLAWWRRGALKKVFYILIGLCVLFVIWQIMPLEHKNRLRTLWNPNAGPQSATESAEGRSQGYLKGMMIFESNPIVGVGVGNFIDYRIRNIDNNPYNAHNLVAQLLAETGIVGGLAFLLMVLLTFINCGRIIKLNRASPDVTLKVLSGLAVACRYSIIILAFEGLGGHNGLRYNWLWIAAFSILALRFTTQRLHDLRT